MIRMFAIYATLVAGLSSLAEASNSEAAAKQERELLFSEIEQLKKQSVVDRDLSIGGYGEIHFNQLPHGVSYSDVHRFVLFTAYSFNDWIQFYSEAELEHSLVADGAGGELKLEQFFTEFKLSPAFNVRLGRVLAPFGSLNEVHEPATFNGVERPLFYQLIIPTTWSLEGFGAAGRISDELSYQVYASNGLDGSQFDEMKGIRDGRLHERPGNHKLATSTKLTWMGENRLQASISHFQGAIDASNKSSGQELSNDPSMTSYFFDASYQWRQLLDVKVAYGNHWIAKVDHLNQYFEEQCESDATCDSPTQIGQRMEGSMVELGVHVMPKSYRLGRLTNANLIAFYRLDQVNTQQSMAKATSKNKKADRTQHTIGLSFLPDPRVVIKWDTQKEDNADENDESKRLYNFGVGFHF